MTPLYFVLSILSEEETCTCVCVCCVCLNVHTGITDIPLFPQAFSFLLIFPVLSEGRLFSTWNLVNYFWFFFKVSSKFSLCFYFCFKVNKWSMKTVVIHAPKYAQLSLLYHYPLCGSLVEEGLSISRILVLEAHFTHLYCQISQ